MSSSPSPHPASPRPGTPSPGPDALSGLALPDLRARFAIGVENLDRRVLELSDDLLDTAFLPDAASSAAGVGIGRWPARVLVGHLADAEVLFVHRMRRTVAEEFPVLALMDEDAFIDAGLYGPKAPVAGFVAVIHTLRTWTAQWLETLSEDQWGRRALHPQRGEQTLRRIVEYDTWHLEHHAAILRRKIDRLVGGDK
jgi:hypothetical protein